MRRLPPVTIALLAINGVIFLANHAGAVAWTVSLPGVFGPGTFLAHFSHVSLWHLAANAYGILIISPILEQIFSRKKYILFLLLLWLVQGVMFPFVQTTPTLGFSGMLMGMIAFLAVRWYGPFGGSVTLIQKQFGKSMLALVGINLAVPLLIPQISFLGHATGAVVGAILALFLHPKNR